MSTSAENRGQFGSKLGFILSAAGSAVGLATSGNSPVRLISAAVVPS